MVSISLFHPPGNSVGSGGGGCCCSGESIIDRWGFYKVWTETRLLYLWEFEQVWRIVVC